jgi:hypothetical protein
VVSALATGGGAKTRVLSPTGTTTLRDGESGLTVTPAAAARAARTFLKG